MNVQHSIQTEQFEESLRRAGKEYSALTYMDNKVYLADGRFDELNHRNMMVKDVAAIAAAMANPQGVDEASIYSDGFLGMYEDYERIHKEVEGTGISPVAAASGPESLTHYETIRKTTDVIGNVIGEKRILEELTAVNIADKVSAGLKGEYIKRTNSLLKVQQEIPDRVIPSPVRNAYSIGKKEIFADATMWENEFRDKDTKIDLFADFQAGLPGMFMQSKHDKAIVLLNAKAGNNLGNWKAVTGNFYDVDAAEDVNTAIKAVEKYEGELIMIAHSDTINGYFRNIRAALDANSRDNSQQRDSASKSGKLPNNSRVTFHESDDLTSESFVLARKKAFMKWLQGMVITTSFDDPRMPAQPKQKFWFDFNGFEIAQDAAGYRGLTTLS